jgi:PknH-like extracellular domain
MRLLVPILAAVILLVAACDRATAGSAQWNPAEATAPMRADDTDSVLLDASQLSQIVGVKLKLDADQGTPIAGSSAAPECSALDAVGMQAFVGDDSTGFHLLLLSDGFKHEHVVAEAVAVYSDSHSAATVFGTATKDLQACDRKEAKDEGGGADWKFAVNELTPDTVRWNKEQTNLPSLWVCYGQARLRNNAIVQAMSCQGDDNGQANVQAMSDQMSANVWTVSARTR